MNEYLYRCSIDYEWGYKGEKIPVYAVAKSEKHVREYVENHLKGANKIKNVCKLGKRLGTNMYHGRK